MAKVGVIGAGSWGIALAKLAEEDPTFRTWTDEETGQTIIAGMGELPCSAESMSISINFRE